MKAIKAIVRWGVALPLVMLTVTLMMCCLTVIHWVDEC